MVFAQVEDAVDVEEKVSMIEKLMDQEIPPESIPRKPTLPVVTKETKLTYLIGPESWILFQILGVEKKDVESWKTNMTSNHSYHKFCNFVQNIECVTNNISFQNILVVL